MFEHRNPISLWKAIAELKAQGAEGSDRIKLIFVGEVSEVVKISLAENGLLELSSFEGYVPKKDLARFVDKSSLLLLCEGDDSSYEFAVPGKLYEYLSMKAPLIAIGPKQWEVSDLLSDLKETLVVTHEQKELMKEFVLTTLLQFISENIPLRTARTVKKFEHNHLCQQLATIIERI
jgi:hypothetical protein